MSERYLKPREVWELFQISEAAFYRRLPALRAMGLRQVRFGRAVRYPESSVHKVAQRAAEREIVIA